MLVKVLIASALYSYPGVRADKKKTTLDVQRGL